MMELMYATLIAGGIATSMAFTLFIDVVKDKKEDRLCQ